MRKRFTVKQKLAAIKDHEAGKPVNRKHAHRRRANDRKVVRPNQMRAADIKYGYIAGRFTLDVFTRELVGSYADYSINSKKAVRVLDEAIKDRGIDPLGFILRSDNGSQYISENFAEYCKLKGIYYDLLM